MDQDIFPTAPLVLVVDAGGTSCRAAVLSLDGACLGTGFAGAANPVGVGIPAAVTEMHRSCAQALAAGGVQAARIQRVLVASAGGDNRTGLGPALAEALAGLGVTAPVAIDADALAAYFSGTPASSGYVLVAGTGAVALRVADGGLERVVDGSGWLLGDVGSGFWVGRRVVRAVLAALDGRGPDTAMTPALLAALAIPSEPVLQAKGRPATVGHIEDAVYALRPTDVARFARLAFTHAGDPVADGIVAAAADGLATSLAAALDPAVRGPVVVAGGLLANPTGLREALADVLASRELPQELVPAADGLVGAAVMGLRAAGVVVDGDLHARVTAEVAARRV